MQQNSNVLEKCENESDQEIQIIKIIEKEKDISTRVRVRRAAAGSNSSAAAGSNSRQSNPDTTNNNLFDIESDDIVEIDSKGNQVPSQPLKKRGASSLADVTYIGSTERTQTSYIRDGRIEPNMTVRDVVTSMISSVLVPEGRSTDSNKRSKSCNNVSMNLLQNRRGGSSQQQIEVIPATQLFPSSSTSRPPQSTRSPKKDLIFKALSKAKALLPPEEANAAPAQLKCSICLELSSTNTKICSTNCGHLFCEGCLDDVFAMAGPKKCPNCRKGISKKGCHRVFLS